MRDPADDPGVPLGHYRDHLADVRLYCRDCSLSRDLPLEAVIARLRARGVGGENTGVRKVARYIRKQCPRCQGSRFETLPAFRSAKRT